MNFSWVAFGLDAAFHNSTKNGASWSWSFGDGTGSAARNPSHHYAAPGSYTVTLTATSTGGVTASLSKTVTIH